MAEIQIPLPEVVGLYRLRNQIMLATVGVILMFIAVPGFLLLYFTQQRLEESVLRERAVIARRIAQPIEATIRERREEMEAAVIGEAPLKANRDALNQSMQELLRWNPSFLEVTLFDQTGQPIAGAARADQLMVAAPAVIRQANWFRAVAPDQPYAALITFSPQQQYVILSQVVRDDYVMVSRLSTDFLQEAVEELRVSAEDDRIYIFTTDRQLVADTLIPPDLTPLGVNIPSTMLNAAHPFTGEYSSTAQGRVLGSSAPIAHTNWVVANEIRASTALADVQQAVRIGSLILMLGLLLTVVAGYLVAQRITRPLQGLVRFAQAMENGLYDQPPPFEARSELGVLALALQRMGQVIAEREDTLRRTNAVLQTRGQELAALSRQVIQVQEEERRRVSRELHDGFGQTLAALKMTLDIAQKVEDPERHSALLADARQISELAINEVHTISQDLRPTLLDDLGLEATLEWYISQFGQRFGMQMNYQAEPHVADTLSPECEITAYRFIQEALNNIYKHAEATEINIRLRQQANRVMLSVRDNGVGFNVKAPLVSDTHVSSGIKGLRERLSLVGGELSIQSQMGKGTTLIALLPQKG